METEYMQQIRKTREYLEYLERHYNNVQKAWKIVQEALKGEPVIFDDFRFFETQDELKNHDLSKLSCDEFVQYRRKFFPTELEACNPEEINKEFARAWEHHKRKNDHHWETWIERAKHHSHPYYAEWACAQMICDWVAMSLAFGEVSPRKYYESKRLEIGLPSWAERDLMKVCEYMETLSEMDDEGIEVRTLLCKHGTPIDANCDKCAETKGGE